MNLNLSGAYRLNELELGLGFDAVYARAKIERFAGDLGRMVAAQNPALAPGHESGPGDARFAHLKTVIGGALARRARKCPL